jgi:hypothetical protein
MLDRRSRRKIWRRALAMGAGGVLGLLAAAPATAYAQEPSAPVHRQAPITAAGWEFFDDYWTHAGCIEEGQNGVQRGEWTQYQCRSSAIDWNLWVLRP